jgi:hypothetical protein
MEIFVIDVAPGKKRIDLVGKGVRGEWVRRAAGRRREFWPIET